MKALVAPLGHGEGVRLSTEAVGRVKPVLRSNGWAEIDNNIAENALRGVALAGKTGCSPVQIQAENVRRSFYSLIVTRRLNGVDPGDVVALRRHRSYTGLAGEPGPRSRCHGRSSFPLPERQYGLNATPRAFWVRMPLSVRITIWRHPPFQPGTMPPSA